MTEYLSIAPEVSVALAAGQPVVALESTIIAQGMPWPDNAETAMAVADAVRDAGATPATVAVIDGRLRVGLEAREIEMLARGGSQIRKCSRRDLPLAVAAGAHGATTVAATMIVANLAGIKVFATGGIGGVHRGAQQSMDVSADLQELARTSVAVVCAGAKAILDLRLTLEYLETYGVPVIGYGTDVLPAFYVRDSGLGLDAHFDTPAEVAAVLQAKWSLGLAGGVVIANPVPEAYALDPDWIEQLTAQALSEAAADGIGGNDATPYLLRRVAELSNGKSLRSNVELVLNNARLGAAVASALSGLEPCG
ncbi:MAG: pseudouridine-5'-phosphate glycosidase [Gammaproteobacteria bacterium]|nr:pseudouridine-5'-phosphate glycosidase [Gammaproteobacteria bacterium]